MCELSIVSHFAIHFFRSFISLIYILVFFSWYSKFPDSNRQRCCFEMLYLFDFNHQKFYWSPRFLFLLLSDVCSGKIFVVWGHKDNHKTNLFSMWFFHNAFRSVRNQYPSLTNSEDRRHCNIDILDKVLCVNVLSIVFVWRQ